MTKLEIAIKALKYIENPIAAIQFEADENGLRVDGPVAVQLSSDPEYLKNIARRALQDIETKGV